MHKLHVCAYGYMLDFLATSEEPDPHHEHSVRKRQGRTKCMVDKDFKIRRNIHLPEKEPAMFQDMTARAINLNKDIVYKHGLIAHGLPIVTSSAAILDMAVCSKLPPLPWDNCKRWYNLQNDFPPVSSVLLGVRCVSHFDRNPGAPSLVYQLRFP